MAYLIVDNEATGERYAKRHKAMQPDAETIRAFIAEKWPGRKIHSHMEAGFAGGQTIVVYVSPNKMGQGRYASKFVLWQISPPNIGENSD